MLLASSDLSIEREKFTTQNLLPTRSCCWVQSYVFFQDAWETKCSLQTLTQPSGPLLPFNERNMCIIRWDLFLSFLSFFFPPISTPKIGWVITDRTLEVDALQVTPGRSLYEGLWEILHSRCSLCSLHSLSVIRMLLGSIGKENHRSPYRGIWAGTS